MAETKLQLNLTLLPVEDRLLLRIATGKPGSMEEYRFLLTRRFVKLFWQALNQLLDIYAAQNPYVHPEGKEAVKQFQESAVLSQTDFSTPYTTEEKVTPLGPNPLLLQKFHIKTGPTGNHMLTLEAVTGQAINITLNIQLIHALRKLLVDVTKEAEWELPFFLTGADAVFLAETPKTIN